VAQIAADEFGVPFEQVRVVVGDTDVVPFGLTGGSRSATMTGGAALHGARQLKVKVLDFASNLLEASVQDLVITDGNVWVRGDPVRAIPVSEVARRAASGEFGAGVDANLEVEAAFGGSEGGWSGGSHCDIVDVDVETGLVRVERYVAAEDCGVLINPAIVEGQQIRGGIAQGIGAVLLCLRPWLFPDMPDLLAATADEYPNQGLGSHPVLSYLCQQRSAESGYPFQRLSAASPLTGSPAAASTWPRRLLLGPDRARR
jgi:aerobic carbon-monoxide dehydrogenase large subunit